MSPSRLLLAAAFLAIPAAAPAQSLVDRANIAAAPGPAVLKVDRFRGSLRGRNHAEVVPGPGERVVSAVPVPHVMNGGGFGLSGHDYYDDAATEGLLRGGRRGNTVILAPALRAPLP